MYCDYSQYIEKSVIEQYLDCSLTHNRCLKQKFCHKQKRVTQTDDWRDCPILVREEKRNEDIKKQENKK